jgi:hypothetical protein
MSDNDQYQSVPQNDRPDTDDGHDGPDSDDDLLDITHENAACLLGDNDQDDAGFERNVCLSGVNSEREIHGRVFEYLCLSKRRSRCMIGATIFVILCVILILTIVDINNINIKQVVHDPDEHFKVSISLSFCTLFFTMITRA